ncbi:hypothetical protein BKA67DRAFT_537303 [Truncatella angustata]|uniref:Uncharacterized protein n=1 Tax=Truncatella angustata TaxID=152316 RepID=A0A9P8ZX74_9PEZI|nr:uncharacterized protein BKA67DRAFT_537303 [Truncatella angustata]KAH6653687.1 hypothetical protein BKA67DRAFT_537303 [Truncatella angustata]
MYLRTCHPRVGPVEPFPQHVVSRPDDHAGVQGSSTINKGFLSQIKEQILSNNAFLLSLNGYTGEAALHVPDRVMIGGARSPARASLRPGSRAPLDSRVPPPSTTLLRIWNTGSGILQSILSRRKLKNLLRRSVDALGQEDHGNQG